MLTEMQHLQRTYPGVPVVIEPEAAAGGEQLIWTLLAEVPDPEIPVLSIVDLGIVRHVRQDADGRLHIGITPTYSGCPATEVIRIAVRAALDTGGHADAVLEEVLFAPLDQRMADERGACQTQGLRHCAPRRAGFECPPPVGCAARDVSALRQPRKRARERVRLDALQGALPLRRLPGAFRLLQVSLRC